VNLGFISMETLFTRLIREQRGNHLRKTGLQGHKWVVVGMLVAILMLTTPIVAHANTGHGTGGDVDLGPQVPLTTQYSTTLNGNYVAAGTGMRGETSGTITATIPIGASLEKAFLIWGMMNIYETPTSDINTLTLNGETVTGTVSAVSGDLCWETDHYTAYFADVTGIAVSGSNSITNFPLTDPETGFLGEGASLILIYSNPGDPLTQVIINFGAQDFYSQTADTPTTFSFSPASGTAAQTTGIVADGQVFEESPLQNSMIFDGVTIDASTYYGADGDYWDTQTRTVTSYISAGATSATASAGSGVDEQDCIGWTGQVLSVAVGAPVTGVPEFGASSALVAALGVLAVSILVRVKKSLPAQQPS